MLVVPSRVNHAGNAYTRGREYGYFSNRTPLREGLSLAGQIAAILGQANVVTVLLLRVIGAESFTAVSDSMKLGIPTGSIVVATLILLLRM